MSGIFPQQASRPGSAVVDKKIFRILDANFNRAKEGLRVCEDVVRFYCDEPSATRRYKAIRHQLTALSLKLPFQDMMFSRDVAGDVGVKSSGSESRRAKVSDIFYANSQRAKESIRVLEEFAKLKNRKVAEGFKKLRYQIYAAEKMMLGKIV